MTYRIGGNYRYRGEYYTIVEIREWRQSPGRDLIVTDDDEVLWRFEVGQNVVSGPYRESEDIMDMCECVSFHAVSNASYDAGFMAP